LVQDIFLSNFCARLNGYLIEVSGNLLQVWPLHLVNNHVVVCVGLDIKDNIVLQELLLVLKLHREDEGAAFSNLRLHGDVSSELVDDLLGDSETQADTLGVHCLGIIDKAEELEQLLLVSLTDSHAIVLALHLDVALRGILGVPLQLQVNLDVSTKRGELQSIRYQVKNDLLKSLRIRNNLKVIRLG
jgi:hypothetical protein